MLEDVAFVNSRWEGEKILVSRDAANRPGVVEHVSNIILYLLKIKCFQNTRWMSHGMSSRTLYLALSVGLESLLKMTRANPAHSDYHLHGFDRLRVRMKKFVTIAAISTWVTESAMLEMMCDARLVRTAHEVADVVDEEVQFIAQLDNEFWKRSIGWIGDDEYTVAELRTDVTRSALVQKALMDWRIFTEVRANPWALAKGDVAENIRALTEEDAKNDPECTGKIFTLYRLGYNMESLVNGVIMLADVLWETKRGENLHGSVAVMHRWHPLLTPQVLSTRSLLHQARALSNDAEEVRKRKVLENKKDSWLAKTCAHTCGRHAFFSDLVAKAKLRHPHHPKFADVTRHILTKHAAHCDMLPATISAKYDAEADDRAATKRKEVSSEIEHIEGRLALFDARLLAENLLRGNQGTISEHRFSDSDWEELASTWSSKDYAWKELDLRSSNTHRPPEKPSPEEISALESFGAKKANGEPQLTNWQRASALTGMRCLLLCLGRRLTRGRFGMRGSLPCRTLWYVGFCKWSVATMYYHASTASQRPRSWRLKGAGLVISLCLDEQFLAVT